jgi:hypothetical protein
MDQNAYRWAELMRLVGLREDVFAEDEQVDAWLVGSGDAVGCDRCPTPHRGAALPEARLASRNSATQSR